MKCSYEIDTINRLLDEIVSSIAQCLDNKPLICVSGDEKSWYIRSHFLYFCEEFQSIHARHLDVTHDSVIIVFLYSLNRSECCVRCIYLYAMNTQSHHVGKCL